jgi:hypothetical protein
MDSRSDCPRFNQGNSKPFNGAYDSRYTDYNGSNSNANSNDYVRCISSSDKWTEREKGTNPQGNAALCSRPPTTRLDASITLQSSSLHTTMLFTHPPNSPLSSWI